jgi:hypothetical protein
MTLKTAKIEVRIDISIKKKCFGLAELYSIYAVKKDSNRSYFSPI